MRWHHRVIRRTGDDREEYFQVHEVYYDDDGTITGWTRDGVSPFGESLEELRQNLDDFRAALDLPVFVERGETLEEID